MLKTSIFKLQVNCPNCNTYHALSGLHEQETCQECGKVIQLRDLFLKKLFASADTVKYLNGFLSGTIQQIGGGAVNQAGAYKMTYSSRAAYCEECFKTADEKDIMDAVNNDKPYKCSGCGHVMPVKAADDFVKEFHPKAIAVLNDSEGIDLMEKDKGADLKKSVIVFSCMTCGAGLQLSAETGRMAKCPYCNNDNYLPDAIWAKLHPDKDVDPFFIILDLDGSDMKSSLDYFLSLPMMKVYEKHYVNFIKEYFENLFLDDSFSAWLKYFLNAKNPDQARFGFDVDGLKRYFYEQFEFGLENQNPELRERVAVYGSGMPVDLQLKLAKDTHDEVRLALSKNEFIDKSVVKTLQNDSSPAVSTEARKHKTGFFKGLFG
jgi:DNA-directed RNA polymerase subunit RPC12/RpoP